MVIYKYSLFSNMENSIEIPKDAKILSCGLDPQSNICIWAAVDPTKEKEKRNVYLVGTGENTNRIDENTKFVGTVKDGPFVWHIFIENKKQDRIFVHFNY